LISYTKLIKTITFVALMQPVIRIQVQMLKRLRIFRFTYYLFQVDIDFQCLQYYEMDSEYYEQLFSSSQKLGILYFCLTGFEIMTAPEHPQTTSKYRSPNLT